MCYNRNMATKSRTTLYLNDDLLQKVKILAVKQRKSVSEIVEELIKELVKK